MTYQPTTTDAQLPLPSTPTVRRSRRADPRTQHAREARVNELFGNNPHMNILDCATRVRAAFGEAVSATKLASIRNTQRMAKGYPPIGPGYKIKKVSDPRARVKVADPYSDEHRADPPQAKIETETCDDAVELSPANGASLAAQRQRDVAEIAELAKAIDGLASFHLVIDENGNPRVRCLFRDVFEYQL